MVTVTPTTAGTAGHRARDRMPVDGTSNPAPPQPARQVTVAASRPKRLEMARQNGRCVPTTTCRSALLSLAWGVRPCPLMLRTRASMRMSSASRTNGALRHGDGARCRPNADLYRCARAAGWRHRHPRAPRRAQRAPSSTAARSALPSATARLRPAFMADDGWRCPRCDAGTSASSQSTARAWRVVGPSGRHGSNPGNVRRVAQVVPGAGELAVVAAVDAVADQRTQLDGMGPSCSMVRYEMQRRASSR